MSTIAQKLEQLAEIKEDIRQAINDKGVEVTTAEPFGGYADKIAEIPQGGEREDAPLLDVNFYDYDGWRCYSYTKDDFLALTAMPEQPQNEGFIAQGWNWTLEQAQAHVNKYRYLEVGAHCATADGKTRLYLAIPHDNFSMTIYFSSNNGSTTTVDWGDGTSEAWRNAFMSHIYEKAGNYIITLSASDGTFFELGYGSDSYCILGGTSDSNGNAPRLSCLVKAELGANVTALRTACFYNCWQLRSINTPSSVTWANNTFYWCRQLHYVTAPATVGTGTFNQGIGLRAVSISYGLTNVQNWFYSAPCILRITLPDSVTTTGQSFVANCRQLYSLYLPDSITDIGSYAVANSQGRAEMWLYPTTPPTLYSNAISGFSGTIYVPHGCLEAYQTATNWAAYAARMVEMEEEI